ncbi:MAG: hypothetical protein ACLR0U_21675 [Enterocloster clostridioformis]
MLLKKSDFRTCILSGLTGASIMMAADCFARSMAGSEGSYQHTLTSVCGVPLLVYLLCKRGTGMEMVLLEIKDMSVSYGKGK